MKLGAFSISPGVMDIKASKLFYQNFGFTSTGGDLNQNWLIMENEHLIIGLFQDMFEKNIITFNPGWDQNANKIDPFTDLREIRRQLKENGIKMDTEANEYTSGPASFVVLDPDGNPILVDQHV